jgi:CBS domain-containing protein
MLERAGAEDSARAVGTIVGERYPHVHRDQGLDLALERMGASGVEILPVVSRADVHQVLGIVTLRDVLAAYGVGAG